MNDLLAKKIEGKLVGVSPEMFYEWFIYAAKTDLNQALKFAKAMGKRNYGFKSIHDTVKKYLKDLEKLSKDDQVTVLGLVWILLSKRKYYLAYDRI